MPKSTLNEMPMLSNSQLREKERLGKRLQEIANDKTKSKAVKRRLMQNLNNRIWQLCLPSLYE